MRQIRFFLIVVVSFILTLSAALLAPDRLLNRAISVTLCNSFSRNSTLCATNLAKLSGQAVAANLITVPRRLPNGSVYMPYRDTREVENKLDSLLAFKTDDRGHLGITREAIQGSTIIPDTHAIEPVHPIDKNTLTFKTYAVEEIVAANRAVDLLPGRTYPNPFATQFWAFSEDFYQSEKHFDNEEFGLGSWRLINLKQKIINILSPIQDAKLKESVEAGKKARQLLGSGLHTLQDFYAHSNWVEMGNININRDLGTKLLCDMPPNVPHDVEISTIECASRPSDKKPGEPTSIKKSEGQYNPGTLDPNLQKLTSGYFTRIDRPCATPLGKTRHGVGFGQLGCPDGLNKDEPGREKYWEARRLAILATQDYIYQILNDPKIGGNIEAVKALMGLVPQPNLPNHPHNP